MPLDGPRLFRSALLIEAAANIGAIFPLVLSPRTCLSYLVRTPLQITPTTLSLTQWLGAIIVLPTVPLLISYPEPTPSQPPSLVTDRRRMTYLMLGASEVALGLVLAGQHISSESGMTDTALLTAGATLTSLVCMRAYLLFIKPKWMEARSTSSRVR